MWYIWDSGEDFCQFDKFGKIVSPLQFVAKKWDMPGCTRKWQFTITYWNISYLSLIAALHLAVIFWYEHSSYINDYFKVNWGGKARLNWPVKYLGHGNCVENWILELVLDIEDWSGADPGFQVRGGVLKKIAPSGGRREKFLGISCENSRFYAKKADYRISLLPLTSNSKNKTVMSKLHCMSNL